MCFGGGVLVGLHIHMAAVVGSFSSFGWWFVSSMLENEIGCG